MAANPRIAPTVGQAGEGTTDLRWVEAEGGYIDLMDATGTRLGYVGLIRTGARGYVFDRADGRLLAMYPSDHPTVEEARARVETEVRRDMGDPGEGRGVGDGA